VPVPLGANSKTPFETVAILAITGAVIVLFVSVCVPVSVTTVLSIEIVPEDVIVPPLIPVPVATEVTVPELLGVT